ncbi:MAG: ethanolamine utilization protein, EutP [Firmicutes bacterium]|nr:ethanolamine utilization protein, EutP [Bacillota bacterium]
MTKIMVVGPVGVGKTSLILALKKGDTAARKTQAISFVGGAIDTPGEYAQITRLYSALLVAAMDASVVLMVKDASDPRVTLPPGFAQMFARPVIGVITKMDLPCADFCLAERLLMQAGVGLPIFMVSAKTGEGIDQLYQFLEERGCCV